MANPQNKTQTKNLTNSQKSELAAGKAVIVMDEAPAPVVAATPPVNGKLRSAAGYQVNFRLPTEEHVAAFDAWLAHQGFSVRPDGICAIVEAWAASNAPELSAKLDAAILASATAEAETRYAAEVAKMEAKLAEAKANLSRVTDDPRIKAAKDRAAGRKQK